MSVAILIVGIDTYRDASFNIDERRLRFARHDCARFERYAEHAWPEAEKRILINETATKENIERYLSFLDNTRFDLLIVYLAGHGDRDTSSAWYCSYNATAGAADVDVMFLDRALANTRAVRSVLFLDCCYSAAIVAGSRFFSSLPDGVLARFALASAHGDQLAWEDDVNEQGIFSSILMSLLDNPTNLKPEVSIDTELFPELAARVSTTVFQRKRGAIQEPVKLGISCAEVNLPTAAGGANLHRVTAVRALIMRVRQIGVGLALAAVLGFLAQLIFLFHLRLDAHNQVAVYAGVRELAMLSDELLLRVELEYGYADVGPTGKVDVAALQAGKIYGTWLTSDARGIRSWVGHITPLLNEESRFNLEFDLTGRFDVDAMAGGNPMWRTSWPVALAADALVHTGDTFYSTWLANNVLIDAGPKCHDADSVASLDLMFGVRPSEDIVDRFNALADYIRFTARPDSTLVNIAIAHFAHRLIEPPRGFEPEREAAALRRAIAVANWRGIVDYSSLRPLMNSACSLSALATITSVAPKEELAPIIALLLEAADAEEFPTLRMRVAIDAIAALAERTDIPPASMTAIADSIINDRKYLDDTIDIEWVVRMARKQALPERLRVLLMGLLSRDPKVESPSDRSWNVPPSQLNACVILSSSYVRLDQKTRKTVVSECSSLFAKKPKDKKAIEAMGILAVASVDVSKDLPILMKRISISEIQYVPRPSDYFGMPATYENDHPDALALSRVLRANPRANNSIVEHLTAYLRNRLWFDETPEIIEALAIHERASRRRVVSATDFRRRVLQYAGDWRARRVETAVLVASLTLSPESELQSLFEEMRRAWMTESDPLARSALMDAQLALLRRRSELPSATTALAGENGDVGVLRSSARFQVDSVAIL